MSATKKDTLSLIRGEMPNSRKRTGGIALSKETFTVAQAEKILEVSRAAGFVNRNLSNPNLRRMAHEMREGRFFTDTGETIKFSDYGKIEVLIDGQHRLEALITSGKPYSFWVMRGIPVKAFRYLDQGKGREVKDILFIEDERWRDNTSALAVAGRMLWRREITGDPTRKPTMDLNESEGNIADAIRSNFGDLPDVFQGHKTLLNATQAERCGPKSSFLFLLYEWLEIDCKLAESVLNYTANRYEVPPPSKYFAWAAQYVDGVREDAAKTSGRITKGRHKDVVDHTLKAWVVAWNLTRSEKAILKNSFQKRLAETEGVPLSQ